MTNLLTSTGKALFGSAGPVEVAGTFVDNFTRAYTTGPLGEGWCNGSDVRPRDFDVLGIVPGGVATIGLFRPNAGAPNWAPNPANTEGAIAYPNSPGRAIPGIACAFRETNTTSALIHLTYGGNYAHAGGKHTEATALVSVTPSTTRFGMGCWFGELSAGVDVAAVGYVGAPGEAFEIVDTAVVSAMISDATPHVFSIDTNGTGILCYVDGVQVSFIGAGTARIPIATELRGSTLHGLSIDQHIVDYTNGQPDLTRMMSAPAATRIEMLLR